MSSGRTKKTLVCAVSGSTWIRIVTYASCVERTNGARLDTNGAVLARHDQGLANEIRDCLCQKGRSSDVRRTSVAALAPRSTGYAAISAMECTLRHWQSGRRRT